MPQGARESTREAATERQYMGTHTAEVKRVTETGRQKKDKQTVTKGLQRPARTPEWWLNSVRLE